MEYIKIGMNFGYDESMPLFDDLKQLQDEFLALQDESQQSKQVYAIAGLCLYWAQCLEMGLQLAIVGVEKFVHGTVVSPEDYDIFSEACSKKTLGGLLSEARKHITIDQNADDLLHLANRKRNYFIHYYFKDRAFNFVDANGKKGMIAEMLKYIQLFRIADGLINCINEAFTELAGLTEDDIQQKIQECIDLRKNGSQTLDDFVKTAIHTKDTLKPSD